MEDQQHQQEQANHIAETLHHQNEQKVHQDPTHPEIHINKEHHETPTTNQQHQEMHEPEHSYTDRQQAITERQAQHTQPRDHTPKANPERFNSLRSSQEKRASSGFKHPQLGTIGTNAYSTSYGNAFYKTSATSTSHQSTREKLLSKLLFTTTAQEARDSPQRAKLMLNAKHEQNIKKQQLIQLEARLRKLEVEEAKARKRINEARRQAEFVQKMKQEKHRDAIEKERYLKMMKREEDQTRQQINESRVRLRQNINTSFTTKHQQNALTGAEIREQKKRIQLAIDQNKSAFLEERQKNYQLQKQMLSSHIDFRVGQQSTYQIQLKQGYDSRVQKTKQESEELEKRLRELERMETVMIQRLQNTQGQVKAELGKLQQVQQIKVPVSDIRFDNYYFYQLPPEEQESKKQSSQVQEMLQKFRFDEKGTIGFEDVLGSEYMHSLGEENMTQAREITNELWHQFGWTREERISHDQLKELMLNVLQQLNQHA